MRPGTGRALALAGLVFLLVPTAGRAQFVDCASPGESWTIRTFRSDYVVRVDGSIGVTETIDVDFGDLRKHGIYREIPVEYRRLASPDLPVEAGRVDVRLDVDEVTDATGEPYEVETSRRGDRVRIRIGSPSFCVGGRQTYVIRYTLARGLGFFDAWDELYWQVTGTGWPAPIERAEATVVLPAERAVAFTDSQPWHADCYAGPPASTSGERCTAEVVAPGHYRFATGRLAPGEGLTLAAAFPNGVIEGPSAAARAWDWILRFGPLGIPFGVLGLMLATWRRRGRDPDLGSVVPEWRPPEGLKPGPAGTLVDQKADMDDVIATILDLAVQGKIRIREVPPKVLGMLDQESFLAKTLDALGVGGRDWEFERIDREPGLAAYEARVLGAVFGGGATRRMSDLKNEFYEDLPDIREALYEELVERGWFARSPDATRKRWMGIAAGVLVVGIGVGILALRVGYPLVLLAAGLSAVVVFGFAFVMPAATRDGARMRRAALGLEEYIRRAEKAEIEFRHAPPRTPELFETLLPYAVALDATDVWVEQFEGILTRPPDWYVGPTGDSWSPSSFGRDLSGFRTAAAATLASAPGGSSGSGSFGGGSVGGGGGGGGGGSW